jgi:hypothetical protein
MHPMGINSPNLVTLPWSFSLSPVVTASTMGTDGGLVDEAVEVLALQVFGLTHEPCNVPNKIEELSKMIKLKLSIEPVKFCLHQRVYIKEYVCTYVVTKNAR